jgi:threonine/homoserine/homoserine lactone efflux protein
MGGVIGEILPLAVGIAISPIPIIAAILMLLSPKARSTGVGFLLGWVAGILVGVIVFTLLSAILPHDDPSVARPIVGIVQLLLGVLLILAAIRQWSKRPKKGEQPALPKWMVAIDTMTAVRGFVLGFLLSAVNPKNLMMAVAAGLAIGAVDLPPWEGAITIAIYTLIAASTVAVPVIAHLVAAERMREPLEQLRGWLLQSNATIMAVLLVVIGVALLGKGLGQF